MAKKDKEKETALREVDIENMTYEELQAFGDELRAYSEALRTNAKKAVDQSNRIQARLKQLNETPEAEEAEEVVEVGGG